MITINFFPYRQAAKRRRWRVLQGRLLATLVLGFGLAWAAQQYVAALEQAQNERNRLLQNETATLNAQIKNLSSVKQLQNSLNARQQTLQNWFSYRQQSVQMLHDFSRLTPRGLRLKSVQQKGGEVLLAGVAVSQERVAEFLRQMDASPCFARTELVEMVQTTSAAGGALASENVQFRLKLWLKTAVPAA